MVSTLLQLSDLHLLADPDALYRGIRPGDALATALHNGAAAASGASLLLLTGDLVQDESWQGYARLRDLLEPLAVAVALLPGNHDRPSFLRGCLGRRGTIAPALVPFGDWWLLLLDSHCSGRIEGWVSPGQRRWASAALRQVRGPVLLAMHHPPEDQHDGGGLLDGLATAGDLRLVCYGHVHRHEQRQRGAVTLLACPSTASQFSPRQPCPLGRPDDPGGRLLQLGPGDRWQQQLLRWSSRPTEPV
ncbi:MAG: metallophosphoesterase [Synechococcus sp.]